jgi:hypothetical protein
MNAKNQQAIYQLGAEWAKTHLPQLAPFTDDYDGFKAWMEKAMDLVEDFMLEIDVSVRLFNQNKRYPVEAHSAFMAGVWDGFRGSTDDLSPIVTL